MDNVEEMDKFLEKHIFKKWLEDVFQQIPYFYTQVLISNKPKKIELLSDF